MGFAQSVKKFFVLSDYDDIENENENDVSEGETVIPINAERDDASGFGRRGGRNSDRNRGNRRAHNRPAAVTEDSAGGGRGRSSVFDMDDGNGEGRVSGRSSYSPGKVVDIRTTTKLQVVLKKPEKFMDVKDIADDLSRNMTIVVNLESVRKDIALRILDFLMGAAYARQGRIQKIARSTFIIVPFNVDISGDLLYELENNGVFFI